MDWVVAAPYFETAEDRWISDAVEGDEHRFTLIPRLGEDRNWHRAKARAGFGEWGDRVRQAGQAVQAPGDGLITAFPQLAAAVGAHQQIRRDRRPLVAWVFNTEGINSGVRRLVARVALREVDRFVVHSTAEIAAYSSLLGLPAERFTYVPFQYGGDIETERPVDQDEPYLFATGSAFRDYETFFKAADKLGYRTLVLSGERALAGLTVPPNVEILDQIPRPEIRRLVRHARVNVLPLSAEAATAGLVTIVEAFRHGRALVATRRPGLEDYFLENETVLCADLRDVGGMAEAIDRMWSDEGERARLDQGATDFGLANCTDEVAARHLVRVLDEAVGERAAQVR